MRCEFAICLATFFMFLVTSCIGEQCECEDGIYQATYSQVEVNGVCSSTQFSSIPIDYRYSQIGKWSLDETNFNYKNHTEIVYLGCAINLLHKVTLEDYSTSQEAVIFQVQGQLDVEEPRQLSGRVSRIEYSRDGQSVICQGVYDVVLKKKAELVVQ